MRFRAKITEIACIRQFSLIVTMVSKTIKDCVLRITHDHMIFIAVGNFGVAYSASFWFSVEQGHIFNEYHLQGVSEENDEIYMTLIPSKFAKILNSLKVSLSAHSLKIKLTKRMTPCLTMEAELPTLTEHARTVVHDLPVQLIPRRDWHLYRKPEVPRDAVSSYMPCLRYLKFIVEKMKNVAARINVGASRSGTFAVSVSSEDLDIASTYRNMGIPDLDSQNSSDEEDDLDSMHSINVDIKKLFVFLNGEILNPTQTTCSIAHNKVLRILLVHDDITLQYFLPPERMD